MLQLTSLEWSNCFSYGANNSVSFIANTITQLVGKNGHGKSSIALVLEEVLFNKNSKGIKKADILNRYVSAKSYSIKLTFNKDGNEFVIDTVRGSTQTVKLTKNGEDISSHTATATYKQIEEIIGMDHKTFCQIVYQSSSSSLEFLTATDTNRKKFLIELLDLTRYSMMGDIIKSEQASASREVAKVTSSIDTTEQFVARIKKQDTNLKTHVEVPEYIDRSNDVAALLSRVQNIEATNKSIVKNNTLKQMLGKITLHPVVAQPKSVLSDLSSKVAVLRSSINAEDVAIKKAKAIHDKCPTCGSQLSGCETKQELIDEHTSKRAELEKELEVVGKQLTVEKLAHDLYNQYMQSTQEYERIHGQIDYTISDTLEDVEALTSELEAIRSASKAAKAKHDEAVAYNASVDKHNAVVESNLSALEEYSTTLKELKAKLDKLVQTDSILTVLAKTFSTNGLVAYKIESLVKDLEDLANQYLVELSDGRFQIAFEVSTSDKLNVVITDNGNDIDILALSNGERARVNVATLLAIRRLMQSISGSKINLLILDETVETMDVEGKEKLVEVLLEEESLNTFLVSHGYTHPLLEKIHVVKLNNISRIE